MLEDTSFAIHPGKKTSNEAIKYVDIGNVIEYKTTEQNYQLLVSMDM